jgi:hypothetical protein
MFSGLLVSNNFFQYFCIAIFTIALVNHIEPQAFSSEILSQKKTNDQHVSVKDFGAKGDGVSDDSKAIQTAIDYAIDKKIQALKFPSGKYRITETIKVGYGDKRYSGINIVGMPSYLGYAEIIADFDDRPAINVQGARSIRIKGLKLTGKNIAPTKALKDSDIGSEVSDWVSLGDSNTKHSPYAGITIDAYSGTKPKDGYQNDSYDRWHSSKVVIDDVSIDNFVVGIAVKPSDDDNNAEDLKIENSSIAFNTYGVSVGGTQQRNVALENVDIYGSYVAITTFRHGKGKGNFPFVYNCNLGGSFRLFEARVDVGVVNVDKIHAESFAEIGIFGPAYTTALHPAIISNSNLHIRRFKNYKPSAYVINFTILKFSGCDFFTHDGQFNAISGSGTVTFEDCTFADLTSAPDRFINVNLPDIYRLNIHNSILSNNPPLKTISDSYKTGVIPKRLSISPNTFEVTEFDKRKEYRVESPDYYVTIGITNVAINNQLLSFETKSPELFQAGDYLFWQIVYTPLNADYDYKYLIPALKVASIKGNRIYAEISASDIDTSYKPDTVSILRTDFVNKTIAIGNLESGSTRITNVENIDNFEVGDWIFGTGLPENARIISISRENDYFDINQVVTKSAARVQIYNSLLKEL